MSKFLSLVSIAWLISILSGCAPVTPMTEGPAPTLPPGANDLYHPLTTQTGVSTIDQTLQAVASGDAERLRSVVQFINAVCTQQEGLGGPPKCREGEAEGTPVEVLAFLGSEGGFLRKDEIGNWPGLEDVSGIYAIYEVNAAAITSEQYYPVGKYVILFMRGENEPAVALRLEDGGIVRVDEIFDASPANLKALIQREASKVLLAPKS